MAKRNNNTNLVLNLRAVKFDQYTELELQVQEKLDKFLAPLLIHKSYHARRITIIVGKGLNSLQLINGKNPLRYMTEKYLEALGFSWRNGGYFDGQEGVIILDI